ncbi:hypothetical protein ElyMa_004323400 [Elysia marginata]|uniref:Mutator-like transposase domain-containing protein n=1 Tax=Elysia marginata TaxID=1093978 RepID=A0AAV4H3Y3_9GAST|nr:hypothetical protein ElyMa_004323400 [Elysia marginata]
MPLDIDEILDITVSYDGSWLTRGRSSIIGIGCVVDVLTGYVIDFYVMSTFCQACQKTGEKSRNLGDSMLIGSVGSTADDWLTAGAVSPSAIPDPDLTDP